MNIFVVHHMPRIAAQSLCDAHVIKMIVESCQLLSTHDRLTGRFSDPSGLFKSTHQQHPCRISLGTNDFNRQWLIHHLHGLLDEYTYRFGKVHKCQAMADTYWPIDAPGMIYSTYELLIDFPLCMPERFKVSPQVGMLKIARIVASYRNYYQHKKQTMKRFKYTRREPPEWLK